MPNYLFSTFPDEHFMDLTLYQYGYEKCRPLHSYGPYVRNHYLFHYVISGKGTLMANDKNNDAVYYEVSAGQGFLIEPDYVNTYFADKTDPWEYTWIEFGGLRIKQYLQTAGLSQKSPIYTPISPEYGDKLKEELLYIAQQNGTSSPLHILGHLYLALDLIVNGSSLRRKVQGGRLREFYAHEAITYIEHNYSHPITIEDLAQQCNLDRSYFGKIFRDTMGKSPQEFLIQYRMSRAAELLKSDNLSIGEISQQVGYVNQLHFSRAFKKTYGISPREYRQKNKIL